MSQEELERLEKLVGSGREFAATLLSQAIEKSESPEQMNNQVLLLQMMSVHLIATCVMNAEINSSEKGDPLLESFFIKIRAEYDFLKSELAEGRLECVKTEIPNAKPNKLKLLH